MKKIIALILMTVMTITMAESAMAEPAAQAEEAAAVQAENEAAAAAPAEDIAESDQNDIQDYLWEISAYMDDEAFETARNRNYKIIKEWEPLFTEDSFHAVYVANVHINQKKEGAKEEYVTALENLEQVKSVAEGIIWLWAEDNMPVYENKEYTEEELDGGKLDGYGFIPYMITYLLDDPAQAKGNILLFSGGSRTNDGEAFPTAVVFNGLGYNCFVVNNRMAPYTTEDSDFDTQRAIRLVKFLGKEKGWGGMDMIALCGFSAGGWKLINNIENAYIAETPDQLGADAYVPDEIDEMPAEFNTAIMVYTGNDEMLKETGYWPALFLVAGSEDNTGATQRLENYYENAKDIVPSELIVYEGAGHGFGSGAEGSMHTTEEASHWPEEADRFMQANIGYNQSYENADSEQADTDDSQADTDDGQLNNDDNKAAGVNPSEDAAAADDIAEDGSAPISEDGSAAVSGDSSASYSDSSIDIHTEDSAVTVEYYDGDEILETQEDSLILVQVPQDLKLENISIFSSGGEINIIGVLADTYDLETVHDDMNVYLPEDTDFHVQLVTISDIFESDFMYDVTMQRHEYIYGDYENGVDIQMETIIGAARVMILQ